MYLRFYPPSRKMIFLVLFWPQRSFFLGFRSLLLMYFCTHLGCLYGWSTCDVHKPSLATFACVPIKFSFDILCVHQVDLQGILSMNPLPLSQGVLLSLLQQLSCDVSKETPRKLSWMRDILSAINPTDQVIAVHVRPIFEQVYQILIHHRGLPSTSGADLSGIRLIMHVINSMLMTCKWYPKYRHNNVDIRSKEKDLYKVLGTVMERDLVM